MDQNNGEASTAQISRHRAARAYPSMSAQEKEWWAMSFEPLYQLAKSKGFGKGREGRKSGRIRIIRWLCEKEKITPFIAPKVPARTTPILADPVILSTGAVSHPEAILRTSDPELQKLIDAEEKQYMTWMHTDLLELAMERSYQLLKDSDGKLPSKSKKAMANWLASWDVLKSPREKRWWLGDGIDLVNKAKAMGYEGPSNPKKYEVIVWLRSTPEEADGEVELVAAPTPNRKPAKRKTPPANEPMSKRPAKGSKRPDEWRLGITPII